MAKPKGPLFSSDAHGSIGDSLTFNKWKGHKRVTQKNYPRNPRTASQQSNRSGMSHALLKWHTLTDQQRNYWQNQVDEKRLQMSGYNYFISDYLVQFKIPTQPVMDSLNSWYKFETGSGVVAYDTQGLTDLDLSNIVWDPGYIGTCLKFNGVSSNCEAQINNVNDFISTDSWSIEFWLKSPIQETGEFSLVEKHTAGPARRGWGVRFETAPGNHLHVVGQVVQSIGSSVNRIRAHALFDFEDHPNVWHHIVVTYNGNQQRDGFGFYIDNVYYGPQPWADWTAVPVTTTHGSPIMIGDDYNRDLPYEGLLDEIRIYSKVLSASDVNQNYNLR